ncbi:DUF6114 domain-containing protein [Actinocorallia sp. API 0066]|uniref:DUF6114 domain-containing protein n=1 Tax=Actinocorallia sp. API 0066 TaxID=2896846 RepID=UPI001E359ECE|nr:DUF6114 domain-containing protein [Actinocorallia sp. API 0066]MCD0451789.1 DUF6114 domain-containing protein [Actinocorallia sp. API 0066]
MNTPAKGAQSPLSTGRLAFRAWRRRRPLWAAIWTALGGFVIFYLPLAPVGKLLHVGVGGMGGLAVGAILMAMALFMAFLPDQRHVAGVITCILGVVSFPLTNLGGFFVGMGLAVLGGSMAFGWLPNKPQRKWRMFRRVTPAVLTPATPRDLTSK